MMSISHVLEAMEVLSWMEETGQLFNERLSQLAVLSLVVFFFLAQFSLGLQLVRI